MTGHIPAPAADARRFLGVGPIARSIADIAAIFEVLSGPDGQDSSCDPTPPSFQLHADAVGRTRVFSVKSDGRHDVDNSIQQGQARAAATLAHAGLRVRSLAPQELRSAFTMWGDALRITKDKSFAWWLSDGADDVNLWTELARAAFGRSRHTAAALGFVALERFAERVPFTTGAHARALVFKDALIRLLSDTGDGPGVMLYPAYPTTAPKHGGTFLHPFGFTFCALWNVLGFPSTAVPTGNDATGLPTAVQVIGAPGADAHTLAVADAIMRARPAWTPKYVA